jgi:hypothetical protein
MRRALILSIASLGLLAGCIPTPGPGPVAVDVQAWQTKLELVTPAASPPPVVRDVLNVAIRAGVPVVCPALAAQAAPAYQAFVTATCAAIVASPDPFTTVTTVLPAMCAGNPPVGASVFPNLKLALVATCPLILQLPTLLKVAQYVPLVGSSSASTG